MNSKLLNSAFLIGSSGNLAQIWLEVLSEKHLVWTFDLLDSISEKHSILDISKTIDNSFVKLLVKHKPQVILLNSGVDAIPGTGFSHLHEFEIDDWNRIFEVNLFGAVRLLNVISENVNWECSVVLLGSIYSKLSPDFHLYSHYLEGNGLIKHPAYSASKHALVGVMQQYATHLAPSGIRINMLSPGGVIGNQDQKFIEKFSSKTPLGRMGLKSELASALRMLIDKDNSYMIGQNILVDGGISLW